MIPPEVEALEFAACALRPLLNEVVFVVGSSVALLLTDPAASSARPTDDIDLVVQVSTLAEYYKFETRMRELGFNQDPAEPVICRWRGHGQTIDLMPTDEQILGFSNPWYRSAVACAPRTGLPSGTVIKVIDAPHFLAAKLVAYEDRGKSDPFSSHDFEDIVIVLNGRAELAEELKAAPDGLRLFATAKLSGLLARRGLVEALEGALGGLQDSFERAAFVLRKMKSMARERA